ncbi:hypothetical protein ANN_22630 [Periplaneta americana]|uniref:DUF4817 domain-containing protein n=1 Tax=Periplaneta americana TaxID=6978 RepID=A0ABQ8S966_PERAM|nr:hypothetical protein ANN_22630 [Periplaneta americana]
MNSKLEQRANVKLFGKSATVAHGMLKQAYGNETSKKVGNHWIRHKIRSNLYRNKTTWNALNRPYGRSFSHLSFMLLFSQLSEDSSADERRNLDVNVSGSIPRYSFSFYCGSISKLCNFIREFGEDIFSTDDAILLYKFGENFISQYLTTIEHKSAVARRVGKKKISLISTVVTTSICGRVLTAEDFLDRISLLAKSLPSKETLRGHSDSSFRGEGYIQCCVGVRLCDMYSNQELAEIHFMYGKADGNAALARRLYQERYPQRQCPDRKTFVRLHYRLCEYGRFNSTGLGRGRLRSTTPEVQEEILQAVNMTPSISTRRVALQVIVPHTTVWRLLKEYQLYPYHLQSVEALSPADYPARVRFCQWFLQQCGVNPNFPALVLFTDEAQFTRDGITNFHNQHV